MTEREYLIWAMKLQKNNDEIARKTFFDRNNSCERTKIETEKDIVNSRAETQRERERERERERDEKEREREREKERETERERERERERQ